jgi:recombinational DNA repair ATPase RecF
VNYLKKIIKYKRIIKLRSQVLKTGKDKKTKEKELSVWDDIFSELSISIYKERKKYANHQRHHL